MVVVGETALTFDLRRLMNQRIVLRDRTGESYAGIVKEIHLDSLVLTNGDGTVTLVSRSNGNIVSVRILA